MRDKLLNQCEEILEKYERNVVRAINSKDMLDAREKLVKDLTNISSQQKQTCKEIDPNCPCWLDGFRTAEAEDGFNWKQELREKLKEMKKLFEMKALGASNVGYRLMWRNKAEAIDDILQLL